MKKILTLILMTAVTVGVMTAQNETIDLNGVFQGKYMFERINGLS